MKPQGYGTYNRQASRVVSDATKDKVWEVFSHAWLNGSNFTIHMGDDGTVKIMSGTKVMARYADPMDFAADFFGKHL